MATEEWVYDGMAVLQSEDTHFYRITRAGAVGIIAVVYDENDNIQDVYFRDEQDLVMSVMHAVHFLSPQSLVLNTLNMIGPTVSRTIRISNPDNNGWWEGLVADVEYVEKKLNAPERETKTAALRF